MALVCPFWSVVIMVETETDTLGVDVVDEEAERVVVDDVRDDVDWEEVDVDDEVVVVVWSAVV
jgi:hypothetical protein